MTNFAYRIIWTGDNLDILRGLNSASVDLIYLDPLFNSNRNYAVPQAAARKHREPAAAVRSLQPSQGRPAAGIPGGKAARAGDRGVNTPTPITF